ncbi:MAG: DNA recombination protein RmuC [Acidobacteria bacterium]|nr:DNA recombination protein RmuC [Acidobacteriota bacterium]
MDLSSASVLLLVLAAGLFGGWLISRQAGRQHIEAAARLQRSSLADVQDELRRTREHLDASRHEGVRLREDNMRYRTELVHLREAVPEKLTLLSQAQDQLKASFDSLAGQALRMTTEEFLKLADQKLTNVQSTALGEIHKRQQALDELIKPIRDTLTEVDHKLGEAERSRIASASAVTTLLREVGLQHDKLRGETQNLVRALRTPAVRGRWGEVQLRRVCELAGLLEQCDFEEQPTTLFDGARQRPDLIVRLPAGRSVIVDAKVPLDAYLSALEAPDDETRHARLRDHARQVRDHVVKLGAKSYWESFQPSPEFVVMFLGAEAIYHAALQEDPTLLEFSARHRVVLAGPMSLIGQLLVVAQGWRHEQMAHNAQEIHQLGRELYERVSKMTEHLDTLRTRLDSTVRAFNDTVGSYETRVLVTARKFKALGATTESEIEPMQAIDSVPRVLQSANLLGLPEDAVVDGETLINASDDTGAQRNTSDVPRQKDVIYEDT